MDQLPIRRALLSVTDKSGLVDFARVLVDGGVELVSTGGTFTLLKGAGLPVTPVSDITGFPEILGGRVKTLHPRIHAGILADKDNPDHLTTLDEHKLPSFEMVCVNLYNFAQAVQKGMTLKQAVEHIDIGGPAMLRAAAKNFHSMLPVPSPALYPRITEELAATGFTVSLELRRELAASTFELVSGYDATIASYLATHRA